MISTSKSSSKDNIYEYYYLIFLFIILIQLFFLPGIRLGVVTACLILIILYKGINKHDLLRNTRINKLVLAYLFYNTISIVWFVFSGIPVAVFFAEWSNSILPIFFFYLSQKADKFNYTFYNITLFVIIISFVLGFYLWMIGAPIYRVFMDTTEGPGTDMMFFQSLYGLTATAAMAVIGFLISTRLVTLSKGKKNKIIMLICIVATILTFRRSAMLVLFIAIIVMHFVGYIKFDSLKKRYFLLELLFLYGIYMFINQNYGDFFENLIERSSMISEAFDERSGTWSYAFQDLSFIFGKGLGSTGHKAIGYSTTLIADGNYFKMIAEIGIVGILIFFAIIINTFVTGLKDFKNKFLELGIVASLCLIAIGSNIFTYQSIAPIFWYSIGRVLYKENRFKAEYQIN